MAATSGTTTTTQSSRRDARANGGSLLLSQMAMIVVAVVLLLAGWMLFVLFGVGPALGFPVIQGPNPPNIDNQNSPPKTDPNTKSPPSKTNDSAASYESQEQLVLLELQRAEFDPRTARLKIAIDSVEARYQAWQRRIQSLLKNDEGRKLVPAARQVRYLLTQIPCNDADIERLRADVKAVRDEVIPSTSPLVDLGQHDRRLANVESQVRSMTTSFDDLNRALDELIEGAKTTPSDSSTLKQVLDKLDAPIDEDVRLVVAGKIREMKVRQSDEIEAANKQLKPLRDRLKSVEEESRQVEANADKQLEQAKTQSAEQMRELELKRLDAKKRMEEALPAFRDRLSPFISKGYRVLQTRQQFVVGIDALPISFSALLRVGALDDDIKGLETLLYVSDSNSVRGMNDRPNGAFPKYTSEFDIQKPQVLQDLKAVQAFLRQHGEAMVDAQLLAP